jgi:hypothetical protein
MTFILNKYIDGCVEKTKSDKDKEIARHLKEIIPKTAHLDERIFKEILNELKKEMDSGGDFKTAFYKICRKYILAGDLISAELPRLLTRIILNKTKFISFLKRESDTPFSEKQIETIFASGKNRKLIYALLNKVTLSKREVVFATFDEKNGDRDPFLNHKVIDIIHRLALNRDAFEKNETLTAIKIMYRNSIDFEKKYPTVIDAGWWDRFYPASENDDYGRTQSLDDSLAGMPEVVHKNMRLIDILENVEFMEDKSGTR